MPSTSVLILILSLQVLFHCNAQIVKVGVVEADLQRALQLTAAVEAAADAGEQAAVAVEASRAPVEPGEPLLLPATVCQLAWDGVVATVSGSDAGASAAAARAGLPLLLVDPAPPGPRAPPTLSMFPHEDVLAEAGAALYAAKGWRHAVLLHEGGGRGAALLAPAERSATLLPRRLPPPDDDSLLRNLLLVLKKSGATNFIVWCSSECVTRVLDAAQRVGLLAARHSYIALALDLHTLPLADYSHGGANITSLRLFDPESVEVVEAMGRWREKYKYLVRNENAEAVRAAKVTRAPPTALVLAYDATRVVAQALEALQLAEPARAANCSAGRAALHADTLLNYIRSEEWVGIAGRASWDPDGERREVQLQVVELQGGGALQAAGLWSRRAGLVWRRQPVILPPPPSDNMTNRTFNILIAENKPYVMKKESAERLSGNDRYEGFCIELIDQLSKILQFNYTLILQPDGIYGNLVDNRTKKWNGMLGRLMEDDDIHFAVTDLTITAQREQAVDFTTPFMNLGISILFHKPTAPEPELFAFLLPFSRGVWICLGFAYMGTSLLLYVVGRLCPEEWQNPYPCLEEPETLENQFTLPNALWFNLGAVLQQGSEIAPVAYGTRAVASVWWLFALVITSSYTANLATLLAKKSETRTINEVRDLAENELNILYGAKLGGSTYTFFQHSKNDLFQKMGKHMNAHEDDMPRSNEDGIQRVMEGNYAFMMESTTIEYTTERNCAVEQIGGLLNNNGYGIAMKKNSTFRQAMNLALLNLQEAGELRKMKHKWWQEKHGGGYCTAEEEHESEELKIANFRGLFLVLVVGCVLGIVLSCCDLGFAAVRRSRVSGVSFRHSFMTELRFVFRFEQVVKPVHGPLSESPSGSLVESAAAEESVRERSATRNATSPAASRRGSRRRSSMQAANARLARHAIRDSATPTRTKRRHTNA